MGKTKTDFTLTNPKSPASKGRTYALYCAVGVDVRDVEGLNNQMAHKFLNDANNGKAYDVREELLSIGGIAAKRDVAKEHRDDPKPTNGKKSKAKPEDADVATLLKLLKQRPELLTSLASLAGGVSEEVEDDEDDEEEVVKPKPKPKAKPTAATKTKKAGTKVRTKRGDQITLNKDDTISDDDLMTMLQSAVKQAV